LLKKNGEMINEPSISILEYSDGLMVLDKPLLKNGSF
jgi:hypothetical protein